MNVHIERAGQIADAIDSPDPEKTLHEQFYAEWKAWEAEDPTRTMAEFDRAIGRGSNYTGKIVRFVTGAADRRGTPFDDGRDLRGTRKVLREADDDQVEEIIGSLPDEAVERVARAVEPRVAPERRTFTREPAPERKSKPIFEKLAQAVFTLWDVSEQLQDEAPRDEERMRLISFAEKAERLAAGITRQLETGTFDEELRALVEQVRAES